jgi:flavin-dependent dehydrogenase
MSVPCDVLIVGGSVAGASLAIHLGRAGLRTVVCDKARFPRRKACGEGLLPHGAAELKSLGFGDPPGARVHGLRYFSPSGASASATFESAGLGPGWVVHRDEFDAWLLDRARATPNVQVRESTAGSAESQATVVVGADGLRSVFHGADFRRTHPRRSRVGVSAVVKGYSASDTVDIHLGAGGEAYVGPAGPDETSLALLLEKGVAPQDFLSSLPAFRNVEIVRPFIGAGPLGSVVSPIVRGNVLLIGDAAGAVDPIAGEGMSLALISARIAAAAIVEAVETGDEGALVSYAGARRDLMAPARRVAALLLSATRFPWLAERAVRKLGRNAASFRRLLRAACGAGPLGILEPARLVL